MRLSSTVVASAAAFALLASAAAFAPPPLRVAPRRVGVAVAMGDPAYRRAYRLIGESTRFTVSGAVAAILLARRDASTAAWALGAILAAVGNKGLKRVIGEARPGAGDDGGMPSSHACSVCHLGVGAALRFDLPPPALAGLAAYAAAALAWRVDARYHTTAQVVVGALYGSATALAVTAWGGLDRALPATLAPGPLVAVFALGAAVVGSLERSKWLKKRLTRSPA